MENSKSTGFTYEVRDDGIKIYRLTDLKRDTVEAFFEINLSMGLTTMREGHHNRSILDVSTLLMPTPYAAKRFQKLAALRPKDSRSSVAILTPSRQLYMFVRTMLSRVPQNNKSHIRLFSSQEEALAWLDERLNELGP